MTQTVRVELDVELEHATAGELQNLEAVVASGHLPPSTRIVSIKRRLDRPACRAAKAGTA